MLRKILIIFIILISFKAINVKAGELDTKIDYRWERGIYAAKEINGEYRWGQLQVFSVGNEFVYCLEPNISMNDTLLYSSSFDFSNMNLSSADKEYLEEVVYYGYGYKANQDIFYYAAVQEIIWEFLGADVYWTTGPARSGEKIHIERYKKDIFEEIERREKPKFSDEVIVAEMGDRINILETNKHGNRYLFPNSPNYDVEFIRNKLEIKLNPEYFGELEIEFTENLLSSGESINYTRPDSQNMADFKLQSAVDSIKINVVSGTIIINQNSLESSLSNNDFIPSLKNTVYELFDEGNNLIRTVTTNEEGRAVILGLPFSNYTIKEKETTLGYKKDNNIYEINLTRDKMSHEININNSIIEENIIIKKVYEDPFAHTYLIEENTTFKIYNQNNKFLEEFITDQTGEINISLPYGRYYLKQSQHLENYQDPEPFEINITGLTNQQNINLYSNLLRTNLKIVNLNRETNNPLPGITQFKIYDINNNFYLKTSLSIDNIFSTDEEGEIIINSIPFGDYQIELIEIPEEYAFSRNTISFNINEANNLDQDIVEVFIESIPVKGIIEISNTSQEVKGFLNNEVILEDKDIGSAIFEVYDQEKNFIEKVSVTSGRGTSSHLPLGEYFLKQIEVNYEPIKESTLIPFSINFQDEKTPVVIAEVTIYNELKETKIEFLVTKEILVDYNAEFNYDYLPASEIVFDIYSAEDIFNSNEIIFEKDQKIKEVITTELGIGNLANVLPTGNYYITQKTILNSYQPVTKKLEFEISFSEGESVIDLKENPFINYLEKNDYNIYYQDYYHLDPISNVEVGIYSNSNLLLTKKTNVEGKIELINFPVGDYLLKEENIPEGYIINAEFIPFSIADEELIINKQKLEVLPSTGSINFHPIIIICLSIFYFLIKSGKQYE